MGLVRNIKFSDFSLHKLMRFDFKYLNYKLKKRKIYKSIKVKEVIDSYFKGFAFKAKDFSSDGYAYILKGDLFNDDFSINFNKIQFLNKRTYLKYKRFNLSKDDVIVSLVGSIGKIVIVDSDYNMLLNQNNISVQVNKSICNNQFFAYILKKEILDLVENIYAKSGYSFLSIEDLFNLEIPNISLDIQNRIIKKIKPLEDEIKILKLKKQESLKIINEVFAKYFNINLDEVNRLENIRRFNLPLRLIGLKNNSLRTSYKWHKLETIQSYIYKDIDCIQKLNKFIINMNNGWSPQSSEVEEGTSILGQEHIQKNGIISLNTSKFTTKTKNNIENFYIKENDFFVSRGNTVELVALASVVTDKVEENILYPDLYIRVDFNELVNKQYMAFLFNSFIGRIYFKHVAKGKNQTMVKVSAKELYDFYVPLPSLDIQEQIIKDMQVKIEAQQNINREIEEKQLEISALIDGVIRKESKL